MAMAFPYQQQQIILLRNAIILSRPTCSVSLVRNNRSQTIKNEEGYFSAVNHTFLYFITDDSVQTGRRKIRVVFGRDYGLALCDKHGYFTNTHSMDHWFICSPTVAIYGLFPVYVKQHAVT
jgi:hypothetical protein